MRFAGLVDTVKNIEHLARLNERLAVIDAAQKNIAALSGEMLSLKDILSNKQARGAYGQGRMEAIVRDGLLLGGEVSIAKDEDPCEVFFSDYKSVNGPMLPHRIEVCSGDEIYGVIRVLSYHLPSVEAPKP